MTFPIAARIGPERSWSRQGIAVGHRSKIRAGGLERLGADATDPHQVGVIKKRPVRLSRFDDPPGQRGPNPGDLDQLRPLGRVQINLIRGRPGLGPVDLDQPPPETTLRTPPSDHRGQSGQHEPCHNGLIGPAEQPGRPARGLRWGMCLRHVPEPCSVSERIGAEHRVNRDYYRTWQIRRQFARFGKVAARMVVGRNENR